MSVKKTLASLIMFLFVATILTAQSTKLEGTWEGKMDHEGTMETITFELHVKGSVLSGDLLRNGAEFGPITDGKIDGNKITFNVAPVSCVGSLEGDQLKVTVTVSNGNKFYVDATRKKSGK